MLNNNYQKILIKFGIWLGLGIVIMITGISNVFAEQVNVGYVTDKTQVLIEASEVQSQPVTLPQGVQNSYGNIYQMYFNIDNIEIKANMLYQLEIYTPGPKLTNINQIYVNGNQTQVCQVTGLVGLNGDYPKLYFKCQTNATSIIASFGTTGTDTITTAQNWYWAYTYLRYFTDDNDIDLGPVISNATNNTNNIINNQNQNTQEIINNQNANTDKEIESQKVCTEYSLIIDNSTKDNYTRAYLWKSDGSLVTSSNNRVTDFIDLSDLKSLSFTSFNNQSLYCLYDNNKTYISCSSTNGVITLPSNARYIRFSAYILNNSFAKLTGSTCKNGNQALNDSIKGLNDSLNDSDSSGATNEASDFFSSFTTNTFGLTSIITAPLNLIQSLTSSTCATLRLPLPYLDNKFLELPCMTSIYQTHFGAFFTMYQTITYGIIAYWVCVRIFNQVKDFKNPEHDEIEVVDL